MPLATHDKQDLLDRLLLKESVIDFYDHEYALLDERDFAGWLALFAADATYTIPVQCNVRYDKLSTANMSGDMSTAWVADVRDTIGQRVEQLLTGVHWAEEPASRTTHLCTNVRVISEAVENGAKVVSTGSGFVVYRNRCANESDVFIGHRKDKLRLVNGEWRIVDRVILLEQSVLQSKNLTTFF